MLGTAFSDIMTPLMTVCGSLGLDVLEVVGAGPDALRALLELIPSRWVEMELRRIRQSNPQKKWEGNDLNDLTALSIAVPYCDIVVTERSWTGMINTNKINRRFDTTVVADVRDVAVLLSEQTTGSA